MTENQIAQVVIGRIKAPLDNPLMAGFVALLDEINALADDSPGFVWRLQTCSEGNGTYLRPYDDDRILFNMSVWKTVEDLNAMLTESLMWNCFGSETNGSNRSRPHIWPFGGCRQITPQGSTKRRNALRTSMSMAPPGSHLLSENSFHKTSRFSRALTVCPFGPVRHLRVVGLMSLLHGVDRRNNNPHSADVLN
jgi:hypothetical protein